MRTILSILSLILTAFLIHAAFRSLDTYAEKLLSVPGDRISAGPPGWQEPPLPPKHSSVAPETEIEEKYPPFEMSKVDFAASEQELAEFRAEITRLYKNSNFKALEGRAAEYRESKARFIGGGWKLHSLFTVISEQTRSGKDADWNKHISMLQQWREAMPESITARTALANAYIEYAWQARGGSYVSEVKDEAWPMFNERLDKAEEEINAARDPTQRCPEFYVTLLGIARAKNWGRGATRKVFDEAVAFEPDYQYIYTSMAVGLMPRWEGAPGEWETFADQVKIGVGGDRGLQLYYLMVSEVAESHHESFFTENHPSWADAKQGFQLMVKEYGVTRSKLNNFARMSLNAGDTQTSCKVFKLLQDPANVEFWKSKENFDGVNARAAQFCSIPRLANQAP